MTDTQAVRMVPVVPTPDMLNAARATLDFGEWIGADYFRKAYKAMVLAAGEAITDDEEEAYKIGKRDGYEAAVQDIDHLTGGDGEYRVSSDDPDRHVPDAYAMKAKIVERFAAAPSVQPDREVIEAKWAGDSTVLGTGWRVEVLASDPLPGEIIDGHQLPRLPGRTACWIRFWPDGRDAPMYRSCDLFDLELSDEAFDALSALQPVAQKEEG